jgi:hypothetical protein
MERDQLKQIRIDINASLAAVAAKHGLSSLQATNATFGGDAFTFKLEGLKAGGVSKEADLFNRCAKQINISVPLGTTFKAGGREYAISGLTTGGTIIADHGGKRYKFKGWDVRSFLEAQGKQPK